MTTKAKVIITIVSLATAFAFVRYSLPEKVVTITKTVEVEKKVATTDSDTNRHKETKTTEKTNTDGSKEVTTVVTEDTNRKTGSKEVDSDRKLSDTSTTTTRGQGHTTLSALVGTSVTSKGVQAYGVSATTAIWGPIAISVWGLNNGIIGAGLGLTF